MPDASTPGRERGATAVVVAIMLVALGGFLALVLNVGHGLSVRGELQNASDAGALAGAWDLDGTKDGIAKAYASALDYATRHSTDASALSAGNLTVEIGRWDPATTSFSKVSGSSAAALRSMNAVHVISARQGDDAMKVFLAGFLGDKQTADVGAEAIAVRGGPSSSVCPFPLAFAACQVLDDQGAIRCSDGDQFVFHSDLTDNVGFTSNTSDVNAVLKFLANPAGGCPVDSAAMGNEITVNNGSQLGATYQNFEALVGGGPYEAPVLDMPCDGDSTRFTHSWPIIGFASVEILFAGQLRNCPDPSLIPAGETNLNSFVLILRLRCGKLSPAPTGGPNLGPLSNPRLVR